MASDDLKITLWRFRGAVAFDKADAVRQGIAQNPEWGKDAWGARGATALHLAAGNGSLDCVKALLPASDANAADKDGSTALILAVAHGHWDCVKALLAASDARAQNHAGVSALMMCAARGRADAVRNLAPRSDLGASARSGETALDMAVRQGHWECADILAAGMSLEEVGNTLLLAPKDEKMPLCRARREAEAIRSAIGGEGAPDGSKGPVGEKEGPLVARAARRI